MTAVQSGTWHQMLFISPEGREEALWVEEQSGNMYCVLSVPVWIYGVSVGSIVEGERGDGSQLKYRRVVRDSPGGTVRFVVPQGALASEIYLTRVIPDAKRLGLYIGPATFFNPRLVAVHVHERKKWWPEVGSYLDRLVSEGVLEQWEVGDPDQYAGEYREDDNEPLSGRMLVHPLPVDGIEGQHVS
ncbi:MAG TPA: DUF4265 domain-containing protein [Gemmatimonadaceae bacterium]